MTARLAFFFSILFAFAAGCGGSEGPASSSATMDDDSHAGEQPPVYESIPSDPACVRAAEEFPNKEQYTPECLREGRSWCRQSRELGLNNNVNPSDIVRRQVYSCMQTRFKHASGLFFREGRFEPPYLLLLGDHRTRVFSRHVDDRLFRLVVLDELPLFADCQGFPCYRDDQRVMDNPNDTGVVFDLTNESWIDCVMTEDGATLACADWQIAIERSDSRREAEHKYFVRDERSADEGEYEVTTGEDVSLKVAGPSAGMYTNSPELGAPALPSKKGGSWRMFAIQLSDPERFIEDILEFPPPNLPPLPSADWVGSWEPIQGEGLEQLGVYQEVPGVPYFGAVSAKTSPYGPPGIYLGARRGHSIETLDGEEIGCVMEYEGNLEGVLIGPNRPPTLSPLTDFDSGQVNYLDSLCPWMKPCEGKWILLLPPD